MSKFNKILVLAIVLSMAIVPLALSGSSDAKVDFSQETQITQSFDDMNAGKITVYLQNDGDTAKTVTVTVVNYEDGKQLAIAENVSVPAKSGDVNGTTDCVLSFSFGSSGERYVIVSVYDGDTVVTDSLNIEVSHSIWKDSTTYIVIIVVIIIIAIAIFLKMRGLPGSKKESDTSEKTFTTMDDERKSKKNSRDKESVETTPVEKQIYNKNSKQGKDQKNRYSKQR
ncbi:MAG: hypothetical protein WCR24_05635 [Candidatus Methanomethylophilaceae archaeon]